MSKEEQVISMSVDCPWCIAKAGEPCYLQNVPNILRSHFRAHLARVAPKSIHDKWIKDHPTNQGMLNE